MILSECTAKFLEKHALQTDIFAKLIPHWLFLNVLSFFTKITIIYDNEASQPKYFYMIKRAQT